jgi:hypothetical protein
VVLAAGRCVGGPGPDGLTGARPRCYAARVRLLALSLVVALVAGAPVAADAFCRCAQVRQPRCPDPEGKRRVAVHIDFAVVDDTVEVLTQSGPYRVSVAELDGKAVLFVFMPRGEVFQGFFEDLVPGSITVGTMQGGQATITTGAAFAPGEYELLLFIDAAAGGGAGPERGDLAAFDNTVCDPTGVSVRVAVGCEDATVVLTNRHFILF